MKIWHGTETIEMPGYSKEGNILHCILAETPASELLPCERLYICHSSRLHKHPGYLTDLYMACGCFDKADEFYSATDHQRKLGDICWIRGDLDEAEQHYLNPKSGAQPYRKGSDDDRLLKLAFYRERWDLVVELFGNASFSRGFSEGRVCVGSSETTAKPFLEILAVALNKLNIETPAQVVSLLENAFGLSASEWRRWRQQPPYCSEQTIKRIQKRCIPKPGRNPPISVEEALSCGNTPRANEVLTYLRECDELIVVAQDALERFGKTGSEDDLGCVIEIVTRSGITSVSHSMLFAVMGHDSYVPRDGLPDRLVRLYSCHPVMNKRHFGKLLDVKFKYGLPLTGAEILTGLFQQRGSLTAILEGRNKDDFFDIGKLAFFRDWAEIRLDDWIQGRGAEAADAVASTWREGKASPVAHPFGGLVRRPPESPRNMSEWAAMLDAASGWLETRWKREVGTSQWVSETQLYQILKRKLKRIQVLHHAQPMWLSPQHLDVLIPEVCLAVEYMGKQHFEPVDHFGGEQGFCLLRQRDAKKRGLCERHGVDLVCVRYDEDVGQKANEIVRTVQEKRERGSFAEQRIPDDEASGERKPKKQEEMV